MGKMGASWFLPFIGLLLIAGSSTGSTDHLDMIKADELVNVLVDEKFVVVLINRDETCTGVCAALEQRLLTIREELAEAVGAWVVRSDTERWNLADNTLVFVRHGAPFVYLPAEEESPEDTLDALLANTKTRVVVLSDATFEHDTQATSGATTGDWLLVFGRAECGEACVEAEPAVEGAAAALHRTMTVARLERDTDAPLTTRRLGVTSFPAVVLISAGKLYRYVQDQPLTTTALQHFATSGYKSVDAEDIPHMKSQLDDAKQQALDWSRENPVTLVCSVVGVLCFIAFVVLLNLPAAEWLDKRSKKNRSKKSK